MNRTLFFILLLGVVSVGYADCPAVTSFNCNGGKCTAKDSGGRQSSQFNEPRDMKNVFFSTASYNNKFNTLDCGYNGLGDIEFTPVTISGLDYDTHWTCTTPPSSDRYDYRCSCATTSYNPSACPY